MITRLKGINRESDLFCFIMDRMEKGTQYNQLIQKTWNLISDHGEMKSIELIRQDIAEQIHPFTHEIREHAFSQGIVLCYSSHFISTVIYITAIGIVTELVKDPLKYSKILTENQRADAEQISAERGREKFATMLQSMEKY
jgi:hypothetical protein